MYDVDMDGLEVLLMGTCMPKDSTHAADLWDPEETCGTCAHIQRFARMHILQVSGSQLPALCTHAWENVEVPWVYARS